MNQCFEQNSWIEDLNDSHKTEKISPDNSITDSKNFILGWKSFKDD